MDRVRSWLVESVRIIAPLLILGVGVFACAAIVGSRKSPERIERPASLTSVETAPVKKHEDVVDIEVSGLVVPHRDISLSAEVSGRIVSKTEACRAGRYVTKGTLLVEIDPERYRLEVARLQGELDQATAALEELKVEVANTAALVGLAQEDAALQKRQLDRTLLLQARNATTESEVDNAKRTELTSRNTLETLRNQKRLLEAKEARLKAAEQLARAKLDTAGLDLEHTRISAPIDGMIVSESVEQNSFVQMGAALLTLEDTSAAEVRCNLRMEELSWLWLQDAQTPDPSDEPQRDYQIPAAPVTVSWELGGRKHEWSGRLSRYEGIGVDEKTRTIPCRVIVEDPRAVRTSSTVGGGMSVAPRALVRGMYVKVRVHVRPSVDMLNVPARAVQPGNTVWRVQSGKLNRVPLENIRIDDHRILLPAGATALAADDLIVVSPLSNAVEGQDVSIRDETAADLPETKQR